MNDDAIQSRLGSWQTKALIVGVIGGALCLLGVFVNPRQFFISYLFAYLFWAGLAFGSLVAGWYLGGLPQTDQAAVTAALHHAFLIMGGLTILSGVSFLVLKSGDGDSVSRGTIKDAGICA